MRGGRHTHAYATSVHEAGGVSGKTSSIYLSGLLTKSRADKYGFPQSSGGVVGGGGGGWGALFAVLTCPVYAQRLMLFANHIL